jgi:hypothetical protein
MQPREPFRRVPVERNLEELDEAVAGDGVEEVLGELHFVGRVDEAAVRVSSPPGRELAAGLSCRVTATAYNSAAWS